MTQSTTIKPLYATVGAGDAVYTAVTDVLTQVRERATTSEVSDRVDEARERIANLPADVQSQFDSLRERLSDFPTELPEDWTEFREKLSTEELRRVAEQYYRQLLDTYSELAERGEETVERLRTTPLVVDQVDRVESLYKDASGRAEEVVDRVSDLIGRSGPSAADSSDPAVVDAEVVAVSTETTPAPAPAPAKKTPARKTTAKSTSPRGAAKKTATRKTAPKKV